MRPIGYSPNADITATFSSAAPLIARFGKVTADLQKRYARNVCRKAMRVVQDAAISNAQKIDNEDDPKAIWKNIAIQNSAKQGKRVGGIVMRVGVRGGARRYALKGERESETKTGKLAAPSENKNNPGGDTRYWRFLEFGTSKMAAQPFLQSALANNTGAVTTAVTTGLNAALDKLAPKKAAP